MAIHAQRDEILFGIVAKRAALTDMVNLEIGGTTAVLAPPLIARQRLQSSL